MVHHGKNLDVIIFLLVTNNAKNTLISPNFLVWNFCGKAQKFYTRKLGEITLIFTVKHVIQNNCLNKILDD